MKKLILSAALLLTTMAASAVPAKSSWKTITQSDGAQLRVMLMGDENFHYYKTPDGVMNRRGFRLPQPGDESD